MASTGASIYERDAAEFDKQTRDAEAGNSNTGSNTVDIDDGSDEETSGRKLKKENGSRDSDHQDEEDGGCCGCCADHTGYRGTTYSALLVLIFWGLCIVFRNVDSSIDYIKVDCSVASSDLTSDVYDECIRHTAIFRTCSACLILFTVQLGVSLLIPKFFDSLWCLKITFVLFLGMSFCWGYGSNIHFDDVTFAWFARLGAFVFLILQCILFLDWAYNFNDNMMDTALSGDLFGRTFDETAGADIAEVRQNTNLLILLVFSLFNICAFIASMGLLYKYFGENSEACADNVTIITISFVGILAACFVQLFLSKHGSILTSSVLALYVTYLTYTSVSLNPRAECNASLANNTDNDTYGVGPLAIGIICSFLSIVYIAFYAAKRIVTLLSGDKESKVPFSNLVSVIVYGKSSDTDFGVTGTKVDYRSKLRIVIMNLNIIFILILFYVSMVFTNWGSIVIDDVNSVAGTDEGSSAVSSGTAGSVSMYMNASSAWLSILLYVFALLFPHYNDVCMTSVWDLKFRLR